VRTHSIPLLTALLCALAGSAALGDGLDGASPTPDSISATTRADGSPTATGGLAGPGIHPSGTSDSVEWRRGEKGASRDRIRTGGSGGGESGGGSSGGTGSGGSGGTSE